MNQFERFTFIYKNALGEWGDCTNPKFIAEHKCCYAILNEDIIHNFIDKRDMLQKLNDIELSDKTKEFMNTFSIR